MSFPLYRHDAKNGRPAPTASNYIGDRGDRHMPSLPVHFVNGNGVLPSSKPPAGEDNRDEPPAAFVVVLDGDQVLLFRTIPIKVSWASAGSYPLRFEPVNFDLVKVGSFNGQTPRHRQ